MRFAIFHQSTQSRDKTLGFVSVTILICLCAFAWICSQQQAINQGQPKVIFNPNSHTSTEESTERSDPSFPSKLWDFQFISQSDAMDEQSNDGLVEKELVQQNSYLRSYFSAFGVNENMVDENPGDDQMKMIVAPAIPFSNPSNTFHEARTIFHSYSYELEQQIYSYSSYAEYDEITEGKSTPTLDPLPNVIFFLADDQGFADLGYNAESAEFSIFTPFIDSLVQKSVRLGSYYSEHLCTPARAALLTGKYPIHNGMQYLGVDNNSPFGLPLTHKTLAQHLQNIGYKTHIVGKWNLGHFNKHYLPMKRGFMSQSGYYTDQCDYYTHKIIDNEEYFTDFHTDEYPFDTTEYSLSVYMSEVENILKDHDTSRPFFLYYAQQAPHMPLDSPPVKLVGEQIIKKAEKLFPHHLHRQKYAEISAALDKSVQHLFDQLKENNLYENTVFIYASDNGGCSAFGANNYPLRGQKNSLYEGGIRVNAFIHSPLIPEDLRSSSFNQLFHVVDWLPTILNGVLGQANSISDLDGIDQWGNILGNGANYRLQMMHNIEVHKGFPDSFRAAVRVGNYKLIYGEYDEGWYTTFDVSSCEACCEQQRNTYSRRTQIYDIEKDMRETQNVYFQIQDKILSMLWKKLDGYWDTMVKAAYKSGDGTALKVWEENDMSVVPWITDPNR